MRFSAKCRHIWQHRISGQDSVRIALCPLLLAESSSHREVCHISTNHASMLIKDGRAWGRRMGQGADVMIGRFMTFCCARKTGSDISSIFYWCRTLWIFAKCCNAKFGVFGNNLPVDLVQHYVMRRRKIGEKWTEEKKFMGRS